MRRLTPAVLAAILLGLPAAAAADCRGTDHLPVLERALPGISARIDAQVAAAPWAEGRFWKAEKDGRTNWLFGTFHSPEPEIAAVPPAVLATLREARTLIVEVAPPEKARLQTLFASDPAMVLDLQGLPTATALSPEELGRLADLARPYGLTAETLGPMRPWFLNMLLATPPCAVEAMARGQRILDDVLTLEAASAAVPVAGLETIEVALDLFREMAPEDQVRLLRLNVAFGHLAEDMNETAGRMYLDEQIYRIWAFNRAIVGSLGLAAELEPMLDDFYRRALTERNRAWLPALRAEFALGNALAAVGALHLAGPDSLQALLAAEGWSVTRLPVAP
jgi:hypothetical protein